MGGCQNYGPFWGTLNIRCRSIMDPKRDHNFDNHVYDELESELLEGDYIGAYTGGHYRGY